MTSEIREILKSRGLRAPKRLTLAVTGVCNLRCAHCWVDAGSASSPSHAPFDALVRLIEEFAALGGEEICLTGGEPLTHPRWLDLMRSAAAAGFRNISLQTNALLLKGPEAEALGEMDFPGLSIQVSLDGAIPRTHGAVRGPGAFKGAVEGITGLVERGLGSRITIFFTEMSHNLGEFPAVLGLADDLGVASVVAGGLVACGRASRESPVAPPQRDEYLSLLSRFRGEERFFRLYDKMGAMAAIEWLKDGTSPPDCCAFVESAYVTPSGVLYPCVLCHADGYSVSGVLEKGLARAYEEGIPLWTELLEISRRRAEEIDRCRTCPEKPGCAGGCIGRAWGTSKDLMAPDDRCELRRAVSRLRRGEKL